MSEKIEGTGLSGQTNMILRDRFGFIKEERSGPNVVTDVGLAEIVYLACGEAGNAWTHIAIGTSSTSATVTDTSLEAEISTNGGGRDASTVSSEQTSTADDTIQLISGWNFSGSLNIRESGVFNAAGAGDMLCRQTFTTLAVGDGDSLTITWKVQLNQA